MSQAQDLLNNIGAEVPEHIHTVSDADAHFVINPVTREITNASRHGLVIMQGDHNSECYTFELPRYIDGHDMLLCNSVVVNYDNIGTEVSKTKSDAREMKDLAVNPANPDTVISSWRITRNATQLVGTLRFAVHYKCIADNGEVVYEWKTDYFEDVEILASKNNAPAAAVEHSDVYEQWKSDIFGSGDSVMTNIASEGSAQIRAVQSESNAQQAAIALKGSQTLATIPEDYTSVSQTAQKASRTKAGAIIQTVQGTNIFVNDSSDDYIRGLHVYGKSTQADTPSPDSPQEIVSIVNPTVSVCGKNLLDGRKTVWTYAGLTYTPTDDGGVIVAGTVNANEDSTFHIVTKDEPITLPKGTYTLSGSVGGSESTYRILIYAADWTHITTCVDGPVTFTLDNPTDVFVYIWVARGSVINKTFYPMICPASFDSTEFESYKIPNTINISRTLRGIPVASGGNYTDSDGRQWICDEVDLDRGVYVNRVNVRTYTGAETYQDNISYYGVITTATWHKSNTGFLCTHGTEGGAVKWANDNHISFKAQDFGVSSADELVARLTEWNEAGKPLAVAYVLREPIETPLTAEEIETYKTLKTNYPNTTILNDADAWMTVEYNADTKTYVDNSKTLRIKDSSTGLVYELKVVNGSIVVSPVA